MTYYIFRDRTKFKTSILNLPYSVSFLIPRYFDNFEKRCMPFYYGGCEGNANNFDSLEDCQKSCPSQFLQTDVCEKPQDGGPCGDYEKRYVHKQVESSHALTSSAH